MENNRYIEKKINMKSLDMKSLDMNFLIFTNILIDGMGDLSYLLDYLDYLNYSYNSNNNNI